MVVFIAHRFIAVNLLGTTEVITDHSTTDTLIMEEAVTTTITGDPEIHMPILPEVEDPIKHIIIQDPGTLQITIEADKDILEEELMQQEDPDLQIIIITDLRIAQTLVPDQR